LHNFGKTKSQLRQGLQGICKGGGVQLVAVQPALLGGVPLQNTLHRYSSLQPSNSFGVMR
jgi:hypothetical protein